MYFSNVSTDLGQIFRLYLFIQHIIQILLKQLIMISRYSSLNFKVHFSSEHAAA